MIVQIEHCKNCSYHNSLSIPRHDQHKYQHIKQQLKNAISTHYPNIKVKVNNIPTNYSQFDHQKSNKYFNRQSSECVIFPRLGSFEVFLNKMLIFSKLKTGSWPNIQHIIQQLRIKIESLDNKISKDLSKQSDMIVGNQQQKEKLKSQNSQAKYTIYNFYNPSLSKIINSSKIRRKTNNQSGLKINIFKKQKNCSQLNKVQDQQVSLNKIQNNHKSKYKIKNRKPSLKINSLDLAQATHFFTDTQNNKNNATNLHYINAQKDKKHDSLSRLIPKLKQKPTYFLQGKNIPDTKKKKTLQKQVLELLEQRKNQEQFNKLNLKQQRNNRSHLLRKRYKEKEKKYVRQQKKQINFKQLTADIIKQEEENQSSLFRPILQSPKKSVLDNQIVQNKQQQKRQQENYQERSQLSQSSQTKSLQSNPFIRIKSQLKDSNQNQQYKHAEQQLKTQHFYAQLNNNPEYLLSQQLNFHQSYEVYIPRNL